MFQEPLFCCRCTVYCVAPTTGLHENATRPPLDGLVSDLLVMIGATQGTESGVAVGGIGVFVRVGVAVGGSGVFVLLGVAVGGRGVLVPAGVGVRVGVAVGVRVGVAAGDPAGQAMPAALSAPQMSSRPQP